MCKLNNTMTFKMINEVLKEMREQTPTLKLVNHKVWINDVIENGIYNMKLKRTW